MNIKRAAVATILTAALGCLSMARATAQTQPAGGVRA